MAGWGNCDTNVCFSTVKRKQRITTEQKGNSSVPIRDFERPAKACYRSTAAGMDSFLQKRPQIQSESTGCPTTIVPLLPQSVYHAWQNGSIAQAVCSRVRLLVTVSSPPPHTPLQPAKHLLAAYKYPSRRKPPASPVYPAGGLQ